MIIWRGYGILIPVVAVAGVLFGGFVDKALQKFLGYYFGFGVNFLFAAFLVFVLGSWLKNYGKQRGEKHNFWFLPAGFWGLLLTGFGFLGISIDSVTDPETGETRSFREPEVTSSPEGLALEAAEKLIQSDREGTVHGNTETAKECAQLFSETAKMLRRAGIEQEKSSSMSLSGGEMLTYCHQSEHGMAFIVHVPGLRKFTDEAKSFMMEAAWMSAERAATIADPPPERLYVATRGVLLYDRGWSGVPTAVDDDEPFGGVKIKNDENRYVSNMLRKYFRAAVKEDASGATDSNKENSQETKASPPDPAVDDKKGDTAAITDPPVTEDKASDTFSLPSSQREWNSNDGGSFVGALQGFVDQKFERAEFVDADGKSYQVPITRFSETDRELLRQYFDTQAKPVP